MSKQIKGKIAVVTGASKGIGASIAKQLAAAGARVVVNYATSREGADRVVDEIVQAGGQATAVQADVSKSGDVDRLLAEAKRVYGGIDILVNNAGIFEFFPLEALTETHFRRQFDLNVLGVLLTSQKVLPYFGTAGGTIINISSSAASSPMAFGSVYAASKAAVNALTGALAQELGGRNIRVNAIMPGATETEGSKALGMNPEMLDSMIAKTPLGRIGQPDDIGSVAVFLASPASGWITGQTLLVAGGAN